MIIRKLHTGAHTGICCVTLCYSSLT